MSESAPGGMHSSTTTPQQAAGTVSAWRGAGRLLAVGAHVVYGIGVVYLLFPRWPQQRRRDKVQQWAAGLVRKCGMQLQVRGAPAAQDGVLLVANHISWIDISVLHAVRFCRFVSKHEVRQWPLVGRLASAADTLYLERNSRRDAHRMLHAMAERLQAGDVLALFPEGTTSDGRELLPFHANLLQAPIAVNAPVQPVALEFLDAAGQVCTTPCYIGDDSLLNSLWRTLCAQGISARISFGVPETAQGRTRQQWAADLQRTVAGLRQQ